MDGSLSGLGGKPQLHAFRGRQVRYVAPHPAGHEDRQRRLPGGNRALVDHDRGRRSVHLQVLCQRHGYDLRAGDSGHQGHGYLQGPVFPLCPLAPGGSGLRGQAGRHHRCGRHHRADAPGDGGDGSERDRVSAHPELHHACRPETHDARVGEGDQGTLRRDRRQVPQSCLRHGLRQPGWTEPRGYAAGRGPEDLRRALATGQFPVCFRNLRRSAHQSRVQQGGW